jgi:hypothetical protein
LANKYIPPGPSVVSLILAFLIGAAALALVHWSTGVQPSVKAELSQVDVVTIVLGALGVMIAILTLFLAVLALYGWATFRSIIEERFDEAMRQRFDPSKDEYQSLLTKIIEDAKSIQLTKESSTEVPKLKKNAKPITGEIR